MVCIIQFCFSRDLPFAFTVGAPAHHTVNNTTIRGSISTHLAINSAKGRRRVTSSSPSYKPSGVLCLIGAHLLCIGGKAGKGGQAGYDNQHFVSLRTGACELDARLPWHSSRLHRRREGRQKQCHKSQPAPCGLLFEVFVTPWAGTRPVDEILYRSEPLTTAGLAQAQMFTLEPEELALSGETSYIAFLTASHFLNGLRSDASVGVVDNVYPAGEFYSHAGPASADLFDRLFTEDWFSDLACQQDLALHLEWSALADVPDP